MVSLWKREVKREEEMRWQGTLSSAGPGCWRTLWFPGEGTRKAASGRGGDELGPARGEVGKWVKGRGRGLAGRRPQL